MEYLMMMTQGIETIFHRLKGTLTAVAMLLKTTLIPFIRWN